MEITKKKAVEVAVTNAARGIYSIIKKGGYEIMRPVLALKKEIKHKKRAGKTKRFTKVYNNEEGC